MGGTIINKDDIVIKIAGDSGDGIQLAGIQLTLNSALHGNDVEIFPDFPSEIRAPQGTLAGVSGFQIHFGNRKVFSPGDNYDSLVALNAAALKSNLARLRPGGVLIVNTSGFDAKNLRLAGYEDENPLEGDLLNDFHVIEVDITGLTRTCLDETSLGMKERDRSRNMFVLGLLYWMYNRGIEGTVEFLNDKFRKKPEIAESNIKVLKAGYHYGETMEVFSTRYEVSPAKLSPGRYRGITGNKAAALGLLAASLRAELPLFMGAYPITPASDILHELAKYRHYNALTLQYEDEIAAMCGTIGAAYGGRLAITATSGPGMSLKAEALGLATMLELPMVIINVQRGGPSTGMPTKTEQSDLMQAFYGRHGEAPLPIIAASSPADCFLSAFEACRIAVEHMTPVILLSDGFLANGAETWKLPAPDSLPVIRNTRPGVLAEGQEFLPYFRNENLVRPWAIPGMKGFEHRIGGLEKEENTGNVSQDPENHQKMVGIRKEKVMKLASIYPSQEIDSGDESGKILVLTWGSTYGSAKLACHRLRQEGVAVSHAHLRYLNPFPANLEEILFNFEKVLIPEINDGQLVRIIRDRFLVNAVGFSKIKGLPFTVEELSEKVREMIKD